MKEKVREGSLSSSVTRDKSMCEAFNPFFFPPNLFSCSVFNLMTEANIIHSGIVTVSSGKATYVLSDMKHLLTQQFTFQLLFFFSSLNLVASVFSVTFVDLHISVELKCLAV